MFLFFFLVVVLVEAFTHQSLFLFSIIDTISLCQIVWSSNSCFKLATDFNSF